jgi:hypothetical protein
MTRSLNSEPELGGTDSLIGPSLATRLAPRAPSRHCAGGRIGHAARLLVRRHAQSPAALERGSHAGQQSGHRRLQPGGRAAAISLVSEIRRQQSAARTPGAPGGN